MSSVLPVEKTFSVAPEFPKAANTGALPLRILHVVNRLDLGGTESGIMKVIAGLNGEEFTHAVCTARGHSAQFAKQHAFSGQFFDATGPGSKSRVLVHRFARIIRKYRPHIVHSRNWGAIEAVLAARLVGVPVIIHSEHGYELEMLEGLPLRRRLLRRLAYAAADAVFTVSSDLRAYHARQAGVSPTKIEVLGNGVDSERFAPRPEKKLSCRANLSLPQNSFLIGAVGRLVPIKGHTLLIQAAKILADRGIELSVAFAGDGPEFEHLRSFAASAGLSRRVYFLGASRSVPDFLNALDVFVLPSVSEGMSNTLLEAMSSGLSVVATRVGGNTELIEDRVSGLLFGVGEVEELTAHLSSLNENAGVRHALGTSARARILADYRLDCMLDRYRNLYRGLAADRKILSARAAN
jgi:sugar transferase (PEP-CTERM/EpsH1 system associated)